MEKEQYSLFLHYSINPIKKGDLYEFVMMVRNLCICKSPREGETVVRINVDFCPDNKYVGYLVLLKFKKEADKNTIVPEIHSKPTFIADTEVEAKRYASILREGLFKQFQEKKMVFQDVEILPCAITN